MKYLKIVLFLIMIPALAQQKESQQDTTEVGYIIVEGDSIPKTSIDLDPVIVLPRLNFNTRDERLRYIILRRKTLKVYPYAKLAADRLVALQERLDGLKRKSQKRRYTRIIHKYIEEEFAEELKKLTKTEGQILVKLIHRQTGSTTFDLIKELRSGWRAFWFNTTAHLFNISLKEEYQPLTVKEDYLIEDILQRAFQNRQIERQKPAFYIDFYACVNKWNN